MKLPNVYGKSVYLSAPMTHMPDHNRTALNKVETACVDAGAAEVYNPAHLIPNVDKGWERSDFMLFDLTQLLEMAQGNHMVVIQLPGWRYSAGCMTEWMVAQQLGIECREVVPIGYILDQYEWITYDFEVFCCDWLVVFKERATGVHTAIWNDPDALREPLHWKRPTKSTNTTKPARTWTRP